MFCPATGSLHMLKTHRCLQTTLYLLQLPQYVTDVHHYLVILLAIKPAVLILLSKALIEKQIYDNITVLKALS